MRDIVRTILPDQRDRKRRGGAGKRPVKGARWADTEDLSFEPHQEDWSTGPGERGGGRRLAGRLRAPILWGLGTIAVTVGALVLLVPHLEVGSNPAGDVDPTVSADPLKDLPDATREALLERQPELPAQLKRSFLGAPADLCAELGGLGLDNSGWGRAPFQSGSYQCASDLVELTTPSVDYGPATLFFVLRGPAQEKIDYLRLKLVVDDPRQKEIGQEAVWLVIEALAERYGWTVPDSFREAISGFSALETAYYGVRLSVAPEDPKLTGDPAASRRLNIVLDFSEPDLIRPADRFSGEPPFATLPSAPAAE